MYTYEKMSSVIMRWPQDSLSKSDILCLNMSKFWYSLAVLRRAKAETMCLLLLQVVIINVHILKVQFICNSKLKNVFIYR